MSGKTVLADTRDATEVLDALLVQSALDHVPAHCALGADERGDTEEGEERAAAEFAGVDEVGDRGEEGDADDAAENAVRPLPEVDRLEVLKRNVLVVTVERGGVAKVSPM